jgi:hypothetical protein
MLVMCCCVWLMMVLLFGLLMARFVEYSSKCRRKLLKILARIQTERPPEARFN